MLAVHIEGMHVRIMHAVAAAATVCGCDVLAVGRRPAAGACDGDPVQRVLILSALC